MTTLPDEIARRRTFAIISHPDAGKTTLTEKLLLFGGAIQMAGEVKARGERRRARSDWMTIERERGISVSSAVMTFEHDGLVFNLLDTPGHQDFSEDTYRTLTAVDSAVMVLDAARGLCAEFDLDSYREGHLTPVFFGSAINNFGVRELLQGVARLAPPPRPQPAEPAAIRPEEEAVAGFVFKVQANIDPQHRDRVAFLRVCAGRFRRGMKLKNQRTGRLMSVQNPVFFLARDRNLAEEAWPGDIIGIPNHGSLQTGDTLTEGAETRVTGLPSFAPEILRRVRIEDPMKSKHLRHALTQLADEGVTRVFQPANGGDWIIGVVGALQLEVLTARLEAEYGLATRLDGAPYEAARWVDAEPAELDRFRASSHTAVAEDHDGVTVFLARNAWDLRTTIEEWPAIRFSATREQH